jgi:hypothetical protein
VRRAAAVLLVLAAGACDDQLKAGRCEKDSDCESGMTCIQDMIAGAYHRCVTPDGGAAGDGGSPDIVKPECTDDLQCSADRPACGSTGACGPCAAGSTVCVTRHSSTPVCGASGACVECASNADCASAAKPACDTQSGTCKPCTADSDCTGRPGPGVCMAHQDGRCASDAETIYVQQTATCVTTADPTAGSATTPFCGLDKGAVALSATRRLFVVRGTVQGTAWTLQGSSTDPQSSIVGQQTGTLAGGASPGLRVVGADLYVRDLVVTLSAQIGISASGGSKLRLERVRIDTNRGGGVLLDGSAFDIRNTTVVGNGPGLLPGDVSWGGIRVQNAPAGGPAKLDRLTVQGNMGPGLLCTATVEGIAVSASGNSTTDIGPTCGITSCGAPSATCGAM